MTALHLTLFLLVLNLILHLSKANRLYMFCRAHSLFMREINFSSNCLVCRHSSDGAQGWRKRHLSPISDCEHMAWAQHRKEVWKSQGMRVWINASELGMARQIQQNCSARTP